LKEDVGVERVVRPSGGALQPQTPVRIGISACLLGTRVRFDGGHKRDAFLVGLLGRFVEWVPVCPEVELGLGTPRESIRLERHNGELRLLAPKSGADHTEAMRAYAERRARGLEHEGLHGFVLKKDSPTCGMERVKVYGAGGAPARNGRGLFAEALLARLPALPIEEEGRLSDPHLRESFVERVFAYRRLESQFAGRWAQGSLVAFHTAHKLQLMSHSPQAYARLGRLVARGRELSRAELRERYRLDFMQALATPATPGRHANVMQHMLGYFSDRLGAEERQELIEVVEDHRRGLLPLVVPLTLMRHQVRRLGVTYLAGQAYLEPHPKELMLRNHV
jgi:uncharacterized protein YbgA (DUF1722 family)/uncharacterized protein YbbK (DUF523 family)